MFLVNTVALHRGLVPSRTSRFVVWARYGLGPNTNSADLERGPLGWRMMQTNIADTPRNRYVNRDRKSTRLNSSHVSESRMPSSA